MIKALLLIPIEMAQRDVETGLEFSFEALEPHSTRIGA